MDRVREVRRIIEPSLEAMGYEVVRVHLSGANRPLLQVMAERADEAAMTVDDCAEVSRTVSALLDVEDPIDSAYTLEVSSPGIDRPLTRLKDFDRFAGYDVRIEVRTPIENRRRFKGRLEGTEDGNVLVALEDDPDDQVALLPFEEIAKAKLVLNDRLLAAGGSGMKVGAGKDDRAGADAEQ